MCLVINLSILMYEKRPTLMVSCNVNGNSILVMCETYSKDGTPHPTNKRYSCDRIMERVMDEENPEFAIEQEYTLLAKVGLPWTARSLLLCRGSHQ
ncbi:Glutamine synthetase 2 cytoplasmic, partial [Geodia barretti]